MLRGIRDRGRAGDESLAYLEWCSTATCATSHCRHEVGTVGCVLDESGRVAEASPALGRRIDPAYIASERARMTRRSSPVSVWAGGTSRPDIRGRSRSRRRGWRWRVTTRSSARWRWRPVAVFVTMKRDESFVWVCGANSAGVPQVECAEVREGTDWVSERVGD